MKHLVYLSLGSNVGDRRLALEEAVRKIKKSIGRVVCQSTFLETEPWGFKSENMFLNAAVCVETTLCPRCLLEATQRIEFEMGRTEKYLNNCPPGHPSANATAGDGVGETPRSYHDRIIDIDILLYDDLTVDEPDLKIPHPLMQERDFVMLPLREILR